MLNALEARVLSEKYFNSLSHILDRIKVCAQESPTDSQNYKLENIIIYDNRDGREIVNSLMELGFAVKKHISSSLYKDYKQNIYFLYNISW